MKNENSRQPFLEKVAQRILADHKGELHDVCIILPSRRAVIYLKRYLASLLSEPVFAPQVYAIEDFVYETSGFVQADQLQLLWELYICYRRQNEIGAQSFEEFLKWGQTLLNDFEDIDMNLADAEALFNYLSEAKAIEAWNPGKPNLTPGQQKYLAFYRSLSNLYQAFQDHLLELRMLNQGLVFRKFPTIMKSRKEVLRWKKYFVAGFNAFTPAENGIFYFLKQLAGLTMLFDADEYYLHDKEQEAGKFLREHLRKTEPGNFQWIFNDLAASKKNIEVIGVPHHIGQVLVAGSLLQEIEKEEYQQTAVVLNDESLLIPLLNAIPDKVEHFNITMGYPFSLTPAYSLVDALFNLHLHASRRMTAGKGQEPGVQTIKFHYRDVVAVIRHPYIHNLLLLGSDKDPTDAIANSSRVFYSKNDVFEFLSEPIYQELLDLIFNDWISSVAASANLKSLAEIILEYQRLPEHEEKHRMDLEYLQQLRGILNRIALLVEKATDDLSVNGLHQLIRTVASSARLPFIGEPLKGVQIMGMLETRVLDFKNIIMLSVNEGILPAGKHGNSFIPFDIRKEFNLPVYSDSDAIMAYHFYRLLQRAENVYLVYNTTADSLGGGEKSRFIMQIEHELAHQNKALTYLEKYYSPSVSFDQLVKRISIVKSDEIVEKLKSLAAYGFSPTALIAFISCPLKFYFSYILGITDDAGVEESMDASTFGSGIHNALEKLFEPFAGQPLNSHIIDEIAKKTPLVLQNCFREVYQSNELDYGKNLLMVKVAESFLARYFKLEKQNLEELHAMGLAYRVQNIEYFLGKEKPIEILIRTNLGVDLPVRLRGKADRIDNIGDQIRLVDFKTGLVDAKKLKMSSLDELITDPDKSIAFQLLMYAWLYAREFNTAMPASGVISFRNLSSGFLGLDFGSESATMMIEFEGILKLLLEKIFDVAEPFHQTDDLAICERCDFKGICAR